MIDYTFFRTELEAERARIVTDLEAIAVFNAQTGDWEAVPDTAELNGADENLEADAAEEWNERRATVAALETTFNDIERALQKIADGEYGICEIGHEPIDEERLRILPTARTCTVHMDQEDLLSL